eukprot:15015-Heterococcus_DN1.PRE.2
MPGWRGYIGEHSLPLTADTDIVKVFTALFASGSGVGTSASKGSSSKRKKGSRSEAAATSAKKKSVSKTRPKSGKAAEE